eukprot:TRINITY_DN8257_c0_g1_i4.p1 TRINITY_DN8257_c0_g1~~TRINITY_DN8257_c0_g1_i4.p1  ORF type:complete len:215 (-),score=2.98 TRINITY_DN8257_c0_g1_i4:128-736(-)
MSGETEDDPIKLVIVGDGATGKTCCLHVFTKGVFPERYVPTVFDTTIVDLEVTTKKGTKEPVRMSLWDTAGQEEYERLRPLAYPNTDVFLVTYSVVGLNSYDNVENKWLKEVRHHSPKVPVILVGTKTDLRNSEEETKALKEAGKKPFTMEQGESLASKIKAETYMECSALKNEGIQELFTTALSVGLSFRRQGTKKKCTIL